MPAFLALVAEPLFLLADAAIVGRLGVAQLAGLGVASAVLLTSANIFVFLAYGTTAVVARQLGAGSRAGAIAAGIDGTWLAIGLGAVTAALVAVCGRPGRATSSAPPRRRIDQAVTYLRISALGIPAMLVVLATTGVLRGLQDTRTPLVAAVGGFGLNIALNVVVRARPALGHRGLRVGHRHRPDRRWPAPSSSCWSGMPRARRCRCAPTPARVLAAARGGIPAARAHPGPARGAARDDLGGGRPRRRAAGRLPGDRDDLDLPRLRPRRPGHRRAGDHRQGPRAPARSTAPATRPRLVVRWGVVRRRRARRAPLLLRPVLGPLFTPDPAVQAAHRGRRWSSSALGQPLSRLRLRRRRRAHRRRRRAVARPRHARDARGLPARHPRGERRRRLAARGRQHPRAGRRRRLAVARLHRLHVGARHPDVDAGAHRPLDGHRRDPHG